MSWVYHINFVYPYIFRQNEKKELGSYCLLQCTFHGCITFCKTDFQINLIFTDKRWRKKPHFLHSFTFQCVHYQIFSVCCRYQQKITVYFLWKCFTLAKFEPRDNCSWLNIHKHIICIYYQCTCLYDLGYFHLFP